jgi:hypothetical protein
MIYNARQSMVNACRRHWHVQIAVNLMKRIHYDVVPSGEDWVVRCDGKDLHRYPSLPMAEAAAFDMARTDRNRGIRADVRTPPEGQHASP